MYYYKRTSDKAEELLPRNEGREHKSNLLNCSNRNGQRDASMGDGMFRPGERRGVGRRVTNNGTVRIDPNYISTRVPW